MINHSNNQSIYQYSLILLYFTDFYFLSDTSPFPDMTASSPLLNSSIGITGYVTNKENLPRQQPTTTDGNVEII